MIQPLSLARHLISAMIVAVALHGGAFAEPELAPQKHEIHDATVRALHEEMSVFVTQGDVANLTFGVWQNGQQVAAGYYGPVSDTHAQTVSDTSIYSIQSMTKPVTAVGLLILMDRGHFELSDPITDFLPEFSDTETLADVGADGTLYTYRAPYPPTMGQLLSHTAGLAYWRDGHGPIDQKLFDAGIGQSVNTDELVRIAASVPYVSMPGAEWRYSMASDIQGAIIERISGEPLASFLQRELFRPLGMRDTHFYVPTLKRDRLCGVANRTERGLVYVEIGDAGLKTQTSTFAEGGHGLYSTQRDYFKFLEFLQNDGRSALGPLLTPETLQRMRTNAIRFRQNPAPQRSRGTAAGLGFGFGVGTVEDPEIAEMSAPKGTYFWRGALGTWFWVDPANDIIFIGMVQTQTPVEPDLLRVSMRAVYGDTGDADPVPPPPDFKRAP